MQHCRSFGVGSRTAQPAQDLRTILEGRRALDISRADFFIAAFGYSFSRRA
jgi:hypothetical protein